MIREGDVFVAELGGSRIGMARLEYLWGKTPFLTSLWVEPEVRRQGVAVALLEYICRMLSRRKEKFLYSSTIPENRLGRAWHRALGFERIGYIDKINPDGGGEVFFRLAIAAAAAAETEPGRPRTPRALRQTSTARSARQGRPKDVGRAGTEVGDVAARGVE